MRALLGLMAMAVGSCQSVAESMVDVDQLIGQSARHSVADGETLLDVARHGGMGYTELLAANPGVDPWLPEQGREVMLPTAHILPSHTGPGVVVNVGDLRLYYFAPDGGPVRSWPIGVGRAGLETPVGTTSVTEMMVEPVWWPTAEARAEDPELPGVVPPGPDNPLGSHAIRIGQGSYLIHGTNAPWGIGRRVSRGCVRMYPEDIALLFDLVKPGTPVTVVDEPVKLGWQGGHLYLEVHPSGDQVDQLEQTGTFVPAVVDQLKVRVRDAAGDHRRRIDWSVVAATAEQRRGTPVRITR